MKIHAYDYDSQVITYKLDTGGLIKVDMAEEILYYHLTPDLYTFELEFKDDSAKDIWFKIDGMMYTALQVIQDAEYQHDDIRAECGAEDDRPYIQGDFI